MAMWNFLNSFKGSTTLAFFQNEAVLLSIREAWQRLLLLTITLSISGCGTSALEWNEQVKLLNGEIIIVKRTAQEGRSLGELGGPDGWEPSEMTLEIDAPNRADKPPVWRFPYVPMLFDYDVASNEWFVIATFANRHGERSEGG